MEQKTKREKHTFQKELLRKQIAITVVSTIASYIVFRYFLGLLFPFIIAYLLMRMTYPLVKVLKKRLRIPVAIGSALAMILTFGILGAGSVYVFGILLRQLKGFMQEIPRYTEAVLSSMDFLCCKCDQLCGWEQGSTDLYIQENMSFLWEYVQNTIMPEISRKTITFVKYMFGLVSVLFIIGIAVINLTMDYEEIRSKFKSTNLYLCISPVIGKLGSVGKAYVKTQGIIMLINSVLLVAGFMFMGSQYALLIGCGIAFMDAFPVIGSGLFLVPIAAIKLVAGNYFHAVLVMILYGLCELVRSFVEPRILGGKIGIKPIFTLMAMYIGFQVFGLLGFLIGPMALVIIKTILEETGCIQKKDEGSS